MKHFYRILAGLVFVVSFVSGARAATINVGTVGPNVSETVYDTYIQGVSVKNIKLFGGVDAHTKLVLTLTATNVDAGYVSGLEDVGFDLSKLKFPATAYLSASLGGFWTDNTVQSQIVIDNSLSDYVLYFKARFLAAVMACSCSHLTITLQTVAAPLPPSALMLMPGLALLGAASRKRRKAS
ncbi:MAG: hypothetical protein PHE27_09495 [Alphaproteobacteria bacterium]|nr:hypothetical protein [Alphaproteobacteria bacterium]